MSSENCKELLKLWKDSTYWSGKPKKFEWAEGIGGNFIMQLLRVTLVESCQVAVVAHKQLDPISPGNESPIYRVYITGLGPSGEEYWSDIISRERRFANSCKIIAAEEVNNKLVVLVQDKEQDKLIECAPRKWAPTHQVFNSDDWAEIPQPL